MPQQQHRVCILKEGEKGFEEFDVTELWNLISVCIKEAVEKAAVAPEQIAGVGVTSFGNGVVFLDKEGYAIAPGCFFTGLSCQQYY